VKRLAAAAAALAMVVPALAPAARAQLIAPTDQRLAGLEWRFVRIRYHFSLQGYASPDEVVGEPWFIDAPAAEQNLTRRLKTATAIEADDPIVLPLDSPEIFQHPWIYFVEPGTLRMTDAEVRNLREFLLRGGTATFDDFHGPLEWDNLARELKRVFPDREIVDLPKDHPVFRAFYTLSEYPQIPGLGSFEAGRTWEKGGYVPHLRTIYGDDGRPMLFINWNTDMGDGWEWSNVQQFPGYIKYTAQSYRMMINEIVYALTH
jgi:Domain of unknown function (DUF4159)